MTNEKIINLLDVEEEIKGELLEGLASNKVTVYTANDFLTEMNTKQSDEQDVDYSELIERVSETDAYVIHTIFGELYVISENEDSTFETVIHENF